MSRTFPWGRPMLPIFATKTQRFQVRRARRKRPDAELAAKAKALDRIARKAWDPADGSPQLRKAPK